MPKKTTPSEVNPNIHVKGSLFRKREIARCLFQAADDIDSGVNKTQTILQAVRPYLRGRFARRPNDKGIPTNKEVELVIRQGMWELTEPKLFTEVMSS